MNSLKLKHFLFLLVLLVVCFLCSCESDNDQVGLKKPPRPRPRPRPTPPTPKRSPPPPRRSPPPPRRPPPPPSPSKPQPGYDYFLLALTWPNGFCKEEGVTCKPSPPKQYFTIHGFWPQNNRALSPTFCEAEQVTDDTLTQLRDGLMQYWPQLFTASDFQRSKALWRRQWTKHGSCSANKYPPLKYFQSAIALEKTYGAQILEVLKNEGIKPDGKTQYSSTDVLNAIKKATNKDALLSCTKDKSGNLQLSEVRLCFNDDAKTIKDCTGRSPSCNQPFLFASPPPPSAHNHLPSLLWSVLEDEEAIELSGNAILSNN